MPSVVAAPCRRSVGGAHHPEHGIQVLAAGWLDPGGVADGQGPRGFRVDLALEVDPNLIGGVVIRSGDTVIDASIRGRLSQLAQTLA